jgi:hypothetical protein
MTVVYRGKEMCEWVDYDDDFDGTGISGINIGDSFDDNTNFDMTL